MNQSLSSITDWFVDRNRHPRSVNVMECSDWSDIPESVLLRLNNTEDSWHMRKLYLDVAPKLCGMINRSVTLNTFGLPPSATCWAFKDVFKFVVKSVDISGLHVRWTETKTMLSDTMMASMSERSK